MVVRTVIVSTLAVLLLLSVLAAYGDRSSSRRDANCPTVPQPYLECPVVR